jgi:UDP-N-acetylmuramoylalanine--D-glutamate ligase
MSSFQLAGVETFRPDIGVVTNLSPDHLDRYASLDAYYADKARIFDNADADSVWVLPADDEAVAELIGDTPGARYGFGPGRGSNAFVDEGMLTLRLAGDLEPLLPSSELPLIGAHNIRNALAAGLVASLAGAAPGGLAAGLGSARALPHRLEPVMDRDGVLWVNDSKATNVAATGSAIDSLDRPIVLLLGGKDKGEDFGVLAARMTGRVRAVLVYGEAADRAARELVAALSGADAAGAPTVEILAGDLGVVIQRAVALAQPGDIILLSPACSSYDMYESYEVPTGSSYP